MNVFFNAKIGLFSFKKYLLTQRTKSNKTSIIVFKKKNPLISEFESKLGNQCRKRRTGVKDLGIC